jgi:hypothetical protein
LSCILANLEELNIDYWNLKKIIKFLKIISIFLRSSSSSSLDITKPKILVLKDQILRFFELISLEWGWYYILGNFQNIVTTSIQNFLNPQLKSNFLISYHKYCHALHKTSHKSNKFFNFMCKNDFPNWKNELQDVMQNV